MRYFIITYGCQMNKSDSERIATVLENSGYKKSSKIDEANLILVNMCSVRQSAVDRVYGKIKDFAKLKIKNEKLKVILTGCILGRDRKKFTEYFDYILDIKDLANWSKIQPRYSSFPIGYVPISTGCNNFCSYCVVPYARGSKIFHHPVEEILSEIKDLLKKGYKEIWLLGQNVNSYGIQHETDTKQNTKQTRNINFPILLRMVNDISGKFWLRFTSSHPKDFSNELIEAMADCEKITPYLNLPVQSGDNEILRRMNRNYRIEDYKNLVKKIRKKIPDITLSTDVIIGFPGETEKQFKNTVKLFEETKFDMAYIAQYSPRPQTTAEKLKDNIPKGEKKKREKILTEILKKTALAKNEKCLGKIIEVLPTEEKNGFLIGKSFHHKTVKFEGAKDLVGKFVKVKVIEATAWGLKGELIK